MKNRENRLKIAKNPAKNHFAYCRSWQSTQTPRQWTRSVGFDAQVEKKKKNKIYEIFRKKNKYASENMFFIDF